MLVSFINSLCLKEFASVVFVNSKDLLLIEKFDYKYIERIEQKHKKITDEGPSCASDVCYAHNDRKSCLEN